MLQKCISLKKKILEEISLYRYGKETPLLDEVPLLKGSPLDSYIVDLNKYILPQLEYIIQCLEKKKRINRRKIHMGRYIVHEWSLNSTLGTNLLEIERMLSEQK